MKKRMKGYLVYFPNSPHELINPRPFYNVDVMNDIVYRDRYNIIRAIYRLWRDEFKKRDMSTKSVWDQWIARTLEDCTVG